MLVDADEGPAQKRNKVPLADVLNIQWKSEGKPEDCAWTTVTLSIPGENEECPITQELISASFLEFLPNVSFRKENPEFSKIQLECGHAFSAMAITYHFFKNGMLCPLCRKGTEKNLAPLCVPHHFRRHLQERLVIERAKDRVEADRENLASAMLYTQGSNGISYIFTRATIVNETTNTEQDNRAGTLDLVGIRMNHNLIWAEATPQQTLSDFLAHHRMFMNVYAYEPNEDLLPAFVTELPADVWSLPPLATEPTSPADFMNIPYESNSRIRRGQGAGPDPSCTALVLSLPRSSLRELGRNLRSLQCPIRYRFVIGTRSLAGTVVEIARSELVDFAQPDHSQGAFGGIHIPSTSIPSGFDIRHLQQPSPDTAALESVVWSIREDIFLSFASMSILQASRSSGLPLIQNLSDLRPTEPQENQEHDNELHSMMDYPWQTFQVLDESILLPDAATQALLEIHQASV